MHLPTCFLTYLLACSPTYLLTHSLTYLPTYLPNYSLTSLLTSSVSASLAWLAWGAWVPTNHQGDTHCVEPPPVQTPPVDGLLNAALGRAAIEKQGINSVIKCSEDSAVCTARTLGSISQRSLTTGAKLPTRSTYRGSSVGVSLDTTREASSRRLDMDAIVSATARRLIGDGCTDVVFKRQAKSAEHRSEGFPSGIFGPWA